MNLSKFPRRCYTHGKTPIEKLEHFSKALGGPTVYIKRDDLLGLTAGGNKTRKLEFLMADAIQKGCNTVITVGAPQSNHCRLTLSAAIKEGFDCHFLIEQRVEGSYNRDATGNNFLYRLLGVKSIKAVGTDLDLMAEMEGMADELKKEGRKSYLIPTGGSNKIGTLGYVSCAIEIAEQIKKENIDINHIVCPSGSGGTHSGLLVGLKGLGLNIPITGMCVNKLVPLQHPSVLELSHQVLELLEMKSTIKDTDVNVLDKYRGPGYSLPTDEMIEAVQLMARTEGILLDPVYSGKTMSGLIDLIRNGTFKKSDNVLFVHTGGSPALYEYQNVVLKDI